jgi:O-antigen/teichoic acid export membrane protein
MSKAGEMAKVSAKGSFHFLWGLVVSTVISAVGTIFIARLLGADNLGLYTIALAAPSLISNFRDCGVNIAITKFSAQYNSENDALRVRKILIAGLTFELIVGLLLALISFSISGFLASIYNRPTIAPLIQIASLFILTGALTTVAGAAFLGLERMHLNSIMIIIQSIVKTGVIILLVILGLGTLGAVIGFSVAALIAALTGILLMWNVYRSLPRTEWTKPDILANVGVMLKYGLPLSIGTIIAGLLTTFNSNIMAVYVTDNALIGNYAVASNFVVLITFAATPVTSMLFPAFSKLDSNNPNDKDVLKNVFQYSVKYAALVVVPVAMIVMSLALPAIETIFADKYLEAPLYLALLSVSFLYAALGNLSMGNIITAQGYTKYSLKLTIYTAAVGFPLGFFLISQFGIIGLIVSGAIVALPSIFFGLRFVKKHFDVSVDWASSAKILFSSGLAAAITYAVTTLLAYNRPVSFSLIDLFIGLFVFLIVFLFAVVLTRTINRADIGFLRYIASSLGPLRRPLDWLIGLIEKLMDFFHVKNGDKQKNPQTPAY